MRIHRTNSKRVRLRSVVNCFQNTNFSEDSQECPATFSKKPVVNCFQNTNFSEDSQAARFSMVTGASCELLSEY